ncbi:hypothetical protein PENSPDRAFT_589469 [Peniophora sp. CONT]|nr:hypothetical protein PENSPDRAFT_589469 [Peniophora sp. CONT]
MLVTAAGLLFDVGIRVQERFSLKGNLEDLDRAISVYQLAVELTPDADSDQPKRLNALGSALFERYQRTILGDVDDLECALSAQRRAVELRNEDPVIEAVQYDNLSSLYLARFQRMGERVDMEHAISSSRRAVELLPNGHPFKSLAYGNLGNAFNIRFDRTGELEDIRQSISALRRASRSMPSEHFEKPALQYNLGAALLNLSKRMGSLDDLELAISAYRSAVHLTQDIHVNMPLYLSSLGFSLHIRFDLVGKLDDLEEAITLQRRALDLAPDGHPSRASCFNKLGNSTLAHFRHTGDLEDLEQSIFAHRCAIEHTPDGHPNKSSWFNNLGCSLMILFERTGHFQDLESSISSLRHAISLTPEGHAYKSSRFHNLGSALYQRFQTTGLSQDFETGYAAYRHALELIPEDHPEKSGILANLRILLTARYRRTNEPEYLALAIAAAQRAIELVPKNHPDLAERYNGLATCIQDRYECTKDPADLTDAISMFHKAIEISDSNQRILSSYLHNLGESLRWKFERTQSRADFDAAIKSFAASTEHLLGDHSYRLRSARIWAAMLSSNPAFSSRESVLSAHSRIIDVLPEIVWLGHDIHRRLYESAKVGELVNAAVAAAISFGSLTNAVVWLEAGRALIWSQLRSLRTPLDELQQKQPQLASALRSMQQQLQQSAHSSFIPESDAFGGVPGIAVNNEADHHRRDVVHYERLLKQIHNCEGFEDFLRPKTLESLIPSQGLRDGPLIFLNVHSTRCDALVISAQGTITSVGLPNLSYFRAIVLCSLWIMHLKERNVRTRALGSLHDVAGELNPLNIILECLWNCIVKPVLDGLDAIDLQMCDDMLPHITWCPTGPLTQLPLHAAGIYFDPHGPRIYDIAVSSYTPSLSALTRSCNTVGQVHPSTDVLIVTQPATPNLAVLPGTVYEGTHLEELLAGSGIASTVFNHKDATVEVIKDVIVRFPWVHLACHGSHNHQDPTKSAFELYDGPLMLSDLMGTMADNAELAFLSACQTAMGDLKTPEESAHLAAGMLAVGFKGVIATMWSIQDADAPVVVDAFYKELLALRSSGKVRRGSTGAAYALHAATKVLRERIGENSFMRWVPFVHFGV